MAVVGRVGVPRTAAVVLALFGALVAAGCSSATASGPAGLPADKPLATLASSIPAGAKDVPPRDPLVITASGGTLSQVTATGPGGGPLTGTLNADKTSWTSAPLGYASAYTVSATAADADGRPAAPLSAAFSTLTPGKKTVAVDSIRPANGQVVGVGMPISIYFDRPVTDKAAVERRLSVTPSVPTVGSFHWVGDDQVNWRPKDYWKAGTVVTVAAKLVGVDTGVGSYGAKDFTSTFTIGHDQQAIGDSNTHQLTLYQDGVATKVLPASFGRPKYPTQFGIHVAFEKHPTKRMRSDSWAGGPKEGDPGFYDVVVPWAVRISANGEFVHVNGATVGQQGRSNVSHGCVNLSPTNGKLFYDWVQIGDPVNIVNSGRPLTPSDGDISDWTIPWEQYVAGSALPPVTSASAAQTGTLTGARPAGGK